MNDIIIQPNHDLGSLRLKIEYKEDHILPSVHYEPLLELLVNSLDNPEVCIITLSCDKGSVLNLASFAIFYDEIVNCTY